MEDKGKKAAGPADGITWDKKTNCIDHLALPGTIHLVPMDYVGGYAVRPGFYEINGATAIPGGVTLQCIPMEPQILSFCCFGGQRRSLMRSCPFQSITASAMCTP